MQPSELSAEEERVRTAYAGRVDGAAHYAAYSAGRLFNYQDLERQVLRRLMWWPQRLGLISQRFPTLQP